MASYCYKVIKHGKTVAEATTRHEAEAEARRVGGTVRCKTKRNPSAQRHLDRGFDELGQADEVLAKAKELARLGKTTEAKRAYLEADRSATVAAHDFGDVHTIYDPTAGPLMGRAIQGGIQAHHRLAKTSRALVTNPARRAPEADDHAARELALYVVNDAHLYLRRLPDFAKNLAAKIKRGTYDEAKAVKLIEYLTKEAAQKYGREFGGTFDAATRRAAAVELLPIVVEQAQEVAQLGAAASRMTRNPVPYPGYRPRQHVRLIFDNGTQADTTMNGTREEVKEFFLGKQFPYRDDVAERDRNRRVTKVIFFPPDHPGGPVRNPASLSAADKRVVKAFTEQTPASSRSLTTDGQRLSGNYMGGDGIATWEQGRIHFHDLGSKFAQTVQRAVAKEAPRNFIANPQQITVPTAAEAGAAVGRVGKKAFRGLVSAGKGLASFVRSARESAAKNPAVGHAMVGPGWILSRKASKATPHEVAIRHSDSSAKEPATVEPDVYVNRYGKIYASPEFFAYLTSKSYYDLTDHDRTIVADLFNRKRPSKR